MSQLRVALSSKELSVRSHFSIPFFKSTQRPLTCLNLFQQLPAPTTDCYYAFVNYSHIHIHTHTHSHRDRHPESQHVSVIKIAPYKWHAPNVGVERLEGGKPLNLRSLIQVPLQIYGYLCIPSSTLTKLTLTHMQGILTLNKSHIYTCYKSW